MIEELLEKIINEKANKWGHTDPSMKGKYRASQLPYCIRKQFFEINDYLESDSVDNGAALSGQATHYWMEELLKEFVVASEEPVEIKIDDGVLLTGHFDLLLEIKGRQFVADIKTIKDYAIRYQPSIHHVQQLSIYQRALGNIDGLLIYIGRNNFLVKVFYFPFDADTYSYMEERAEYLHSFIRSFEIPPPEAKESKEEKWQCSFCPYKSLCDEIEKKRAEKNER